MKKKTVFTLWKLQVTQNTVVRFILDFGQRASVDNQALHKVNMLCVNDRVKQLRLNHVYGIMEMLLTICVIISFLLIITNS